MLDQTTKPKPKKKAKRCKRLTPEQKKAVWAKPEANAGAGWRTDWENRCDPRVFERGEKE